MEPQFFRVRETVITLQIYFVRLYYDDYIHYLSSYNRWLCQARSEDLSDIASLKALYQTGEFKNIAIYSFTS